MMKKTVYIEMINIYRAILFVQNIKMIYCTFWLQLTRKLIIFGLLPPTAQHWGSGRMVSKLGGDLHEMPFMWFEVRAFDH